MSNLTFTPAWSATYQIETTDDVLGGAGALANEQAQALGNRTEFLKQTIEGFRYKTVNSSLVVNYPATYPLNPVHGTLYNTASGNAGLFRLPAIATVDDNTTFAIYPGNFNRAFVAAAVGENIEDAVSFYPTANQMTVWAMQTLVLYKSPGATVWRVLARHGDFNPAEFRQIFGAPSYNKGYLVCNGSAAAAADYPRLFAIIGYTFGGSGGTFYVPNISPATIGGVTVYTSITG